MTMLAAAPRTDDYGGHVVYLDWDREFIPWLRGKKASHQVQAAGGYYPSAPGLGLRLRELPLPGPWKPGEHWALIGPTGEGKSTFGVGITGQRRWVVALDPKGEDETLEAAGYMRVRSIPLPRDRFGAFRQKPRPGTDDWVWDRVERLLPVGLVAGFEALSDAEDEALRQLMGDAILWVKRTRGWTLYIDEFELLSSQRMMRQAARIENMLITARRAGTSVVTSFQAPAWVSKHATRQARKVTLFPTRDTDMVQAVARSMGRDWRMVAAVMNELPPYHSLTLTNQVRRPMIVTVAPQVS